MLETIIILLFGTIVLIVFGVYSARPETRLKQRIQAVVTPEAGKSLQEELEAPFIQRVVLPLSEGVAKLLRARLPDEARERLQKRLAMAGVETRLTAIQFQGFQWISAILCTVLMLMLLMVSGIENNLRDAFTSSTTLLYILVGTTGGYILPQFILGSRIRKRQEDILYALPYGLDLLSITVEAGLGFDAALAYTMRKMKGPLAEEFAKALNEIRLGKPRLEALQDLGARSGVEDLKIFVTAVIHASRLGSSITTTLRVQADSLRVRRRQHAQERALKAPVKMTFPLVFLIFPAMFVVILGPAVLTLMKFS